MRFNPQGLTLHNKDRATPGLTIFSPLNSHDTLLINMAGEVVHRWQHPEPIATYAHLLPNGNLLASLDGDLNPKGIQPPGGLMRELDWEGNTVWEHRDAGQHHDVRRLPNGNTVYLGWELMTETNAARVKGGRRGSEHEEGIWAELVREVDPAGTTVWEWRAQERLNIEDYPIPPVLARAEWGHANTVVPVGEDGYFVEFRDFNLLAVIDKKSGEFSWHMQNPDWGFPHDSHFLANGNILMFSNRVGVWPLGSEVLELDGNTGEVVWKYAADPHHTFNSPFISGAQRLETGNTLICEGMWGCLFEVTPDGEIVWEYVSPHTGSWSEGPLLGEVNATFRAYRYAEDSPEIQGRAAA